MYCNFHCYSLYFSSRISIKSGSPHGTRRHPQAVHSSSVGDQLRHAAKFRLQPWKLRPRAVNRPEKQESMESHWSSQVSILVQVDWKLSFAEPCWATTFCSSLNQLYAGASLDSDTVLRHSRTISNWPSESHSTLRFQTELEASWGTNQRIQTDKPCPTCPTSPTCPCTYFNLKQYETLCCAALGPLVVSGVQCCHSKGPTNRASKLRSCMRVLWQMALSLRGFHCWQLPEVLYPPRDQAGVLIDLDALKLWSIGMG